MVRQQGQMQHLGIADEHRGRVAADLAPEMIAGVAVVEGGRGPGLLGPAGDQALQPGQLVLGQGLEREKIEGAGLAVTQMAFQHRQVVDQALAAGRGRGHHHGMPGADVVRGQGLMAVKAAQAAFLQRAPDGRGPRQAAFRVHGRTRGLAAVVPHLRPQLVRGQQGPDIFSDAHDGPPLPSWPRPPHHLPPKNGQGVFPYGKTRKPLRAPRARLRQAVSGTIVRSGKKDAPGQRSGPSPVRNLSVRLRDGRHGAVPFGAAFRPCRAAAASGRGKKRQQGGAPPLPAMICLGQPRLLAVLEGFTDAAHTAHVAGRGGIAAAGAGRQFHALLGLAAGRPVPGTRRANTGRARARKPW